MQRFHFPSAPPTEAEAALRQEVRAFLAREQASGRIQPAADCWVSAASADFSERLGAQGWLGMTWPKAVGGHERPMLHRYVVTEELLATGAPVAAHWIADRQSGPQILRYGTPAQRAEILPRIAAGRCYFAIGMSEPHAGSDLAAVTTRAERTAEGWRLNGRKIWSTGAHFAHYMIVLARTGPPDGRNRQIGLSQFLVDLATPGITISGLRDLAGSVHFNETLFEDVMLPADALLGAEGGGWAQVVGELAMERSGPERFLTTFALIDAAIAALKPHLDSRGVTAIGRIAAHLMALRQMSRGIARLLQDGGSPETEAALVKELGTRLEGDIVAAVRDLTDLAPADAVPQNLATLLADAVVRLPSNTLRGGTSEIMRGIIARQLGMR